MHIGVYFLYSFLSTSNNIDVILPPLYKMVPQENCKINRKIRAQSPTCTLFKEASNICITRASTL